MLEMGTLSLFEIFSVSLLTTNIGNTQKDTNNVKTSFCVFFYEHCLCRFVTGRNVIMLNI